MFQIRPDSAGYGSVDEPRDTPLKKGEKFTPDVAQEGLIVR